MATWAELPRLIRVEVLVDGMPVPIYHKSTGLDPGYYAEAKPGAEYTLRYTNLAREPIGANLYVDGHEADLWHLVSTKFHHEGFTKRVKRGNTQYDSVTKFCFAQPVIDEDEGDSEVGQNGSVRVDVYTTSISYANHLRPSNHQEKLGYTPEKIDRDHLPTFNEKAKKAMGAVMTGTGRTIDKEPFTPSAQSTWYTRGSFVESLTIRFANRVGLEVMGIVATRRRDDDDDDDDEAEQEGHLRHSRKRAKRPVEVCDLTGDGEEWS